MKKAAKVVPVSCFMTKSNDGREVRVTLWSDETWSFRFIRTDGAAMVTTQLTLSGIAGYQMVRCMYACIEDWAKAKDLMDPKKGRKSCRK